MDVDIDILRDYKLTPNQYTLIYLVHDKQYSEFYKLKDTIGEDKAKEELENAQTKGFVKLSGDRPEEIEIRKKFLFIIEEGDYFDEFVEEYPVKVIRPDGTKDYLRADLSRSRRNYHKITNKSRKKHEHLLKCLKFEKQVREQESSWKYMKKLPKWLSSEEWKVFEERMKDEEKEKEGQLGYGQQLI